MDKYDLLPAIQGSCLHDFLTTDSDHPTGLPLLLNIATTETSFLVEDREAVVSPSDPSLAVSCAASSANRSRGLILQISVRFSVFKAHNIK